MGQECGTYVQCKFLSFFKYTNIHCKDYVTHTINQRSFYIFLSLSFIIFCFIFHATFDGSSSFYHKCKYHSRLGYQNKSNHVLKQNLYHGRCSCITLKEETKKFKQNYALILHISQVHGYSCHQRENIMSEC